jgi:hypothetical protein
MKKTIFPIKNTLPITRNLLLMMTLMALFWLANDAHCDPWIMIDPGHGGIGPGTDGTPSSRAGERPRGRLGIL